MVSDHWERNPLQTGRNDLVHRRGKNPGYFVADNGSAVHMIWVAPGTHHCTFYTDEDKSEPCKGIKTEAGKQPREFVFFKSWNVRHADGGWKGNYGLSFYLNLITKD